MTSTWAVIQREVIAPHGCASTGCHDSGTRSGGLDLSPDVTWQNLVGVASPTYGVLRVSPGGKQDSFLWQKLAAARGAWDLAGRGAPMPSGREALSAAQLELIGRWIHDGAPIDGVVPGTEQLADVCVAPAEPLGIAPPPAPALGTGTQFFAPAWTIQPPGLSADPGLGYGDDGEDEVCYATFFDLLRDGSIGADDVFDCPPYWLGPSNPAGKCYASARDETTQEPNSHHSIIRLYRGGFDVTDAGFDFRCHDGEARGAPCDPRVASPCPAPQQCRGTVKSSLGCLTYGPPDFSEVTVVPGAGAPNSPSVGGAQQPSVTRVLPDGVFRVLPAQGVMVWNSHAFDVWDEPVQNRQWWNVYFVDPSTPGAMRYQVRAVFDTNDIFVQDVPPFEQREYCRTITFGRGTRLFELSSHTHRFGRLFRVFPPPIAPSCRSTPTDPAACRPETTAPVLVTTEYNDPAQVAVPASAPFHALDADDPAARRFKFCAVYDNGATDPATVKRNSTAPTPPPLGFGGPCRFTLPDGRVVDRGVSCLAGPHRGQPCNGDDRVCDSRPDVHDGVCDACPVSGGVTTADEMFVLTGSYYCDTTVPGETCTGVCNGGPRDGLACHGNDSECPGATGACRQDGRCGTGVDVGAACAADADCHVDCVPYTN